MNSHRSLSYDSGSLSLLHILLHLSNDSIQRGNVLKCHSIYFVTTELGVQVAFVEGNKPSIPVTGGVEFTERLLPVGHSVILHQTLRRL